MALEDRFIDPKVEENLKKLFRENIPHGYGVVCILVKDVQHNIITNIAPKGVQYALNHAIKNYNEIVDN